LIQADSIDGNNFYYSLSDWGFDVMWGEFAEDVIAELERIR
jgi:hypothetical protein